MKLSLKTQNIIFIIIIKKFKFNRTQHIVDGQSKTHDLIFNDKIYLDTCPTGDDIWFYIVRLLNNVKGYLVNKKWLVKDLTEGRGLYSNFNKHNNNRFQLFRLAII